MGAKLCQISPSSHSLSPLLKDLQQRKWLESEFADRLNTWTLSGFSTLSLSLNPHV